MGQGSDSAGGDDFDYEFDQASHDLKIKIWTKQNGDKIQLKDMTLSELNDAKFFATKQSFECLNDDIADHYINWFNILSFEVESRTANSQEKKEARGKKTKMTCSCGKIYFARDSDLKRGWGKSCSKSCAAMNKGKK